MIEFGAGLNIFGLVLDMYGAWLIFTFGLLENLGSRFLARGFKAEDTAD